MNRVSAAWKLIESASKSRAGLMIFNQEDRVVYSNPINSAMYGFIDFESSPTYAETFQHCLAHRWFTEERVYRDPQAWLDGAMTFRRGHAFAQFTGAYSDGRVYMITHEVIPEIGSYYARTDITERLKRVSEGGSALLGPDVWAGRDAGAFDAIQDSLATTPMAAAVISAAGGLVEANAQMETLFEDSDGITLVGNRVKLSRPDEHTKFKAALTQLSAGGKDTPDIFLRISQERSAHALLMKLSRCATPRGLPTLIAVTVVQPDSGSSMPASVLSTLFDLTPAEARVALAVGQGDELKTVAMKSGTALNTVRTQMSNILAKTGLGRQLELVRLINIYSALFRPKPKQ